MKTKKTRKSLAETKELKTPPVVFYLFGFFDHLSGLLATSPLAGYLFAKE
jgi:hypothetical protein